MKKLVLNLLLAAIFSVGAANAKQITMTLNPDGKVTIYLAGTGKATIDWGDRSKKTKIVLNPHTAVEYTHVYTATTARTIKIKGKNILGLQCDSINLTALNISKCVTLMYLNCSNNRLTTLDVSRNVKLTDLLCYGNQLTSLNVGMNTALTHLNCHGNQLASLDVSRNTALTFLNCGRNHLAALDVSRNTALLELYCPENILASLDVSLNSALTLLSCFNNRLTALDVSANRALLTLGCSDNQLTSLDVRANTALLKLYCHNNQLRELDVSHNTALKELWCFGNSLDGLDISHNTSLAVVESKNIPNIKVAPEGSTHRIVFRWHPSEGSAGFNIAGTGAIAIDWGDGHSQAHVLPNAQVRYQHEYADVQHPYIVAVAGRNITGFDCSNNNISALDVRGAPALTALNCSGNQLTALNVSNNTALTALNCEANPIVGLNVSRNTRLTQLESGNIPVSRVDVYNKRHITMTHSRGGTVEFYMRGSGDVSIDWGDGSQQLSATFSNETMKARRVYTDALPRMITIIGDNITVLQCNGLGLTSLDVSANPALIQLCCSHNNLTSLDLSNCRQLSYLLCISNPFSAEALNVMFESLPDNDAPLKIVFAPYHAAANKSTATGKGWQIAPAEGKMFMTGNFLDYSGFSITGYGDATIDWGDGSPVERHTLNGEKKITPRENYSGEHTITITGEFITKLNCSRDYDDASSPLSALDVGDNVALTELYCYNNPISRLDVSKNILLEILDSGTITVSGVSVANNQAKLDEIDFFSLHPHIDPLGYLQYIQNVKTDLGKMGLRGKVKTIEYTAYDREYRVSFNEIGNITEIIRKNKTSDRPHIERFVYNPRNGLLVHTVSEYYTRMQGMTADEKRIQVDTFRYDEKGNHEGTEYDDAGNMLNYAGFEYNPDGTIAAIKVYYLEDKYEYRSDGTISRRTYKEVSAIDDDDISHYDVEYTYNSNRDIVRTAGSITQTYLDEVENFSRFTGNVTYVYDLHGNWTRKTAGSGSHASAENRKIEYY